MNGVKGNGCRREFLGLVLACAVMAALGVVMVLL